MRQTDIAVIIPTRNEETTIADVIAASRPHAQEIVVIDGYSTDATCRIAREHGARVIAQSGKGKGAALREAIREVEREILVFIDADGSHETADIPKLVAPILKGEADLVIASRYLGGSDEFYGNFNNFVRMMGSALIALGINHRWKLNLTDVENGFRAVRRDAVRKLPLKADDFTIEQEMVMKALKKGYRIEEVASHEYERKGGVSKLPTREGWKFIWNFLLNIW